MSELEKRIPRLTLSDYKVKSPRTPSYNCIAWAAGDDQSVWWPDRMGIGFWPDGVPRNETASAFIEAFARLGYETCGGPELEAGYEKVAIFFDPVLDKPAHAARQLPSGSWTSKMGDFEDIEHADLKAVSGSIYGRPKLFLRRLIKRGAPRENVTPAAGVGPQRPSSRRRRRAPRERPRS